MSIPIGTANGFFTRQATAGVLAELGGLLTVHEVAELLRVPVSWVYERTRRRGMDRLPHLKIGKYVRFRFADVNLYLERFTRD